MNHPTSYAGTRLLPQELAPYPTQRTHFLDIGLSVPKRKTLGNWRSWWLRPYPLSN